MTESLASVPECSHAPASGRASASKSTENFTVVSVLYVYRRAYLFGAGERTGRQRTEATLGRVPWTVPGNPQNRHVTLWHSGTRLRERSRDVGSRSTSVTGPRALVVQVDESSSGQMRCSEQSSVATSTRSASGLSQIRTATAGSSTTVRSPREPSGLVTRTVVVDTPRDAS